LLRRVEERLSSLGRTVLILHGKAGERAKPKIRLRRPVVSSLPGISVALSRHSLHGRLKSRRHLLGLPSFGTLRPLPGEEVVAKWGASGDPALLFRRREEAKIWSAGFPLDHLASEELTRFVTNITGSSWDPGKRQAPVPDGSRAVVILLHD